MKPKEISRVYEESEQDVHIVVNWCRETVSERGLTAENCNLTALAEEAQDCSGVVVDEEVYHEVAYYVVCEI